MILTYYIQCTGKYHESVARIGTSAAGTSTNTGNGQVMFPSTLCVMYLSYGQLCLAGQGDKNLDPKEQRASNQWLSASASNALKRQLVAKDWRSVQNCSQSYGRYLEGALLLAFGAQPVLVARYRYRQLTDNHNVSTRARDCLHATESDQPDRRCLHIRSDHQEPGSGPSSCLCSRINVSKLRVPGRDYCSRRLMSGNERVAPCMPPGTVVITLVLPSGTVVITLVLPSGTVVITLVYPLEQW